MRAHTTTLIAKNEDFFLFNLDNGGVRFGMYDICAFDFPVDHAECERVKALTLEAAEEAFDAFYVNYMPLRTDGYAHIR